MHRHRREEIRYADSRKLRDPQCFADPVYDIRDIVASQGKFALRLVYTAKAKNTGEPMQAEVIYFSHLRDAKIAEFDCFPISSSTTKRRADRSTLVGADRGRRLICHIAPVIPEAVIMLEAMSPSSQADDAGRK